MAPNAWVPAPAWGSIHTAADEDQDAVGDDIEGMCDVCMAKQVSIYLLPCKHPACDNCVNKLRAANIFKVLSVPPSSPDLSKLPSLSPHWQQLAVAGGHDACHLPDLRPTQGSRLAASNPKPAPRDSFGRLACHSRQPGWTGSETATLNPEMLNLKIWTGKAREGHVRLYPIPTSRAVPVTFGSNAVRPP